MLFFYLSMIDAPEEKSKLEKLYCEYRYLMKHIALNILHNDTLAEDAVHNAFLKLANHLKKIDEIKCHKTKAFIVIVIRSVSIDISRKEKRCRLISIDETEQLNIPDRNNDGSMGVQDILSAIKELPDTYRDILELKAYHELSDKEIADVLGISHSATRKRLERARNALRKILDEEE